MLGHCCRRREKINLTLVQRLVFAGDTCGGLISPHLSMRPQWLSELYTELENVCYSIFLGQSL